MLTTWLIISLISLIFSALFSGTEIAYVTSDRVRVELDVNKGGFMSRILSRFYSDSELFISTILVGNNIMLVVYGMGAAALLDPWLKEIYNNEVFVLLMQTLISTTVILITGEFLPKTIFRINPNRSLKLVAMPVYIFYVILYPISLFSAWLSKSLMNLLGIKNNEEQEGVLSIGDLNRYVEQTIDEHESEQKQVEHEVKIFQNALDFSSTHLKDCMIPRNELVAINIDTTTREELSELFTTSGRSKIVVYRDDIDNVLGYIHVSELFDLEQDWKKKLKPVLFAPETLLANKMMKRLLGEKKSMAVIVDEFGGTSGLVTLEDLVEEIFGDIQDEHDNQKHIAREIEPGVYEFSGRAEIAEINDMFHLDIPEDDEYQTLAGYVLFSTGSIPEQGDTIAIEGLEFSVLKKSATKLELLKVTKMEQKEE